MELLLLILLVWGVFTLLPSWLNPWQLLSSPSSFLTGFWTYAWNRPGFRAGMKWLVALCLLGIATIVTLAVLRGIVT